MAFIFPQPSDAEIESLYAEEYFTACSETVGAHGTEAYLEQAKSGGAQRRVRAAWLDRKLRNHLPAGGQLLEVGCGPGFFLAAMKEVGWQVKGLEISSFAAQYGREHLGLEILVAPIADGSFPAATFQAILMTDVLEHLPDPVASLRAVRSWLAPGGILAVAVPSTMNLLSAQIGLTAYRALGRFKTLRIPPYHLFEYTPRTLRTTLATAGFRLLELDQSAVPIDKMGLRGTAVENSGKVALQLLAHLTARVFNRGGDRLFALAVARS